MAMTLTKPENASSVRNDAMIRARALLRGRANLVGSESSSYGLNLPAFAASGCTRKRSSATAARAMSVAARTGAGADA